MLNYIWLGLIVLAVIIGGCTDHLKEVAAQSFEMAEFAVMKTALPANRWRRRRTAGRAMGSGG